MKKRNLILSSALVLSLFAQGAMAAKIPATQGNIAKISEISLTSLQAVANKVKEIVKLKETVHCFAIEACKNVGDDVVFCYSGNKLPLNNLQQIEAAIKQSSKFTVDSRCGLIAKDNTASGSVESVYQAEKQDEKAEAEKRKNRIKLATIDLDNKIADLEVQLKGAKQKQAKCGDDLKKATSELNALKRGLKTKETEKIFAEATFAENKIAYERDLELAANGNKGAIDRTEKNWLGFRGDTLEPYERSKENLDNINADIEELNSQITSKNTQITDLAAKKKKCETENQTIIDNLVKQINDKKTEKNNLK